MDTFKTKSGKTLAVAPIKHASMELDFDGLVIQVDPVTDGTPPVTDYTQWRKADVILITHDHYDHVDAQAVAALSKDGTVVVANGGAAALLGCGEVLCNGDSLQLRDDLVVHAVAAYNTTPGHTQFHPKGRDNGYVLTIDGLRIYIAGDTEDIPEMASLKDIDVAFLPCNQPYTMTPEQVAKAARTIKPKVLFPYHYSQTPIKQVASLLAGSGIDVRIRNYQ